MYTIASVIILIICILIILIVLVQNSKGGGLASNFSNQNQYMGVKKTTDFLEKSTWTLAIALFVFSLIASLSIENPNTYDDSDQVQQEEPAQQENGGEGEPSL